MYIEDHNFKEYRMACKENSEFDRDYDTQYLESIIKMKKSTERNKNRDSHVEGNWRTQSGQNHYRYEYWRTNRHSNLRSDMDKNWRAKKGENTVSNNQESLKSYGHYKGATEGLEIEEDYSTNEISGCWKIKSNKWKESEDVWKAVVELHLVQPNLFTVPPRRWSFSETHPIEYIQSYISSSCNKVDIKEAADAIREKVYFSFVMLYEEAPLGPRKPPKYQHTPENEFYELDDKYYWKIALKDDSSTASGENDVTSSNDSKSENLLSLGAKSLTLGPSGINDSFAHESPSNKALLPSQVKDEEYLYFPSTIEAIDKVKSSICGKWLVYDGFNLAKHDKLWNDLLPLCTEGTLVGMKASTSVITDAQQYMGGEVILCYTADAYDMNDVKKAGDAIQKVSGYKYILYYKTNASSEKGLYKKEGVQLITSYMLTVKGTFYVRDEHKRWTLTEL